MKIVAAIFLIFYCILFIEREPVLSIDGKPLYERHCAKCHGHDGARGRFGARDLKMSQLDTNAMIDVITRGRRIMPAWEKTLTQEEIVAVVAYVKLFRKAK